MGTIKDLVQYLGRDFSADHWSDEAIDHGYELINRLAPCDWGRLSSIWQSQPAEWQHRLAQVLYKAEPESALFLLSEMLRSPDDELVQEAVDTLSAMDNIHIHLQLDGDSIARLKSLARARPGLDARTIGEVLSRLGVSPH